MEWEFIDQQSRVDTLLPELMQEPNWGTDTEDTGLDPHKDKVTALQFGTFEKQFIIDTRCVNIEPLRPFLVSREHKKILHNAKFDYKMMKGTHNVEMENLRCTFLQEKVLGAGRKDWGYALDDVLKTRLDVEVDKELQKSFIGHKGPYSLQQKIYMANDVKYLIPLAQNQAIDITKEGLRRTVVIENNCIQAFGDMEYHGLLLDKDNWRAIMAKNLSIAKETREELEEIIRPFWGENLFGEIDINLGSPAQIVELLHRMGVKVTYTDENKNDFLGFVKSTNKDTMKKIKDLPVIRLIQRWRSVMTRYNTFGQNFIDSINPITGCIHPDVQQMGTETGRPSSGDDEDRGEWGNINKIKKPNPLNIPRDNEYRHSFVCLPDEVVESDDYSGCESRILAHISKDPKLLDIFRTGKDVHCAVATDMYGIPVAKDIEYAKQFNMEWVKENKKFRTPAKSLNFGISYGMGPEKLYNDLNAEGFPITREAAKKLYYTYCERLSVSVNYIRGCGRQGFEQGYLENLNGRKRWWRIPDKDDPKYNLKKGAIEREGGNFMIQSVNADITKKAMADIRDYRIKHNIRTKMMNAVYDEIVTRTHKDDHPEFHKAKLRIMQEAGEHWITSVPMIVDGSANPYWSK